MMEIEETEDFELIYCNGRIFVWASKARGGGESLIAIKQLFRHNYPWSWARHENGPTYAPAFYGQE